MQRESVGQAAVAGIRLRRINYALIAVSMLFFAGLMLILFRLSVDAKRMRGVSDQYIQCQQDAVLLEEASDFLTDESRYFVQNGEIQHAADYMHEIEVDRRRERIREDESRYELEEDVLYYLDRALGYSDELVQTEVYAMRLGASAWQVELAQLPNRIARIQLASRDSALPQAQQAETARQMLYDETYQQKKSEIHRLARKAMDVLINDAQKRQNEIEDHMTLLRRWQQVLLIAFVLVSPLTALIHTRLVLRPLSAGLESLEKGEAMPVAGVREMRSLAARYNEALAENNLRSAELSYSASHDPLTGLYNRAAYESALKAADKRSIAILVIDVDKFKDFNDRYGHDVGDEVLRRVARELKKAFRSEDHISRIGGDEFCVIMKNADSHLSYLVRAKVNAINRALAHYEDKTPPAALSVGVAFGDRSEPDMLFKNADTALYRVKAAGGGCCEIY